MLPDYFDSLAMLSEEFSVPVMSRSIMQDFLIPLGNPNLGNSIYKEFQDSYSKIAHFNNVSERIGKPAIYKLLCVDL